MGGGNRRDTRWIIAVLAGALVASAVVVYALVRMTAPSGDGPVLTAITTSTTDQSTSLAPDSSGSGTTQGVSGSADDDPSSSTPTGTDAPSSTGTYSATQSVPAATSAKLPNSQVVLPAAWSGVAKVTITVLGECAATNSSVYADLPADLALDLIQNEANAAQTSLPAGASPGDITLTLGVNSSGVPSLALYSSQVDEQGTLQRFWNLKVTGDTNRTLIHGTLTAQPVDGSTPNMMVDAETSQQPCESLGTVSLPRALAGGATIDGWVTSDSASLTLKGVTTDKKRMVSVEITARRAE